MDLKTLVVVAMLALVFAPPGVRWVWSVLLAAAMAWSGWGAGRKKLVPPGAGLKTRPA